MKKHIVVRFWICWEKQAWHVVCCCAQRSATRRAGNGRLELGLEASGWCLELADWRDCSLRGGYERSLKGRFGKSVEASRGLGFVHFSDFKRTRWKIVVGFERGEANQSRLSFFFSGEPGSFIGSIRRERHIGRGGGGGDQVVYCHRTFILLSVAIVLNLSYRALRDRTYQLRSHLWPWFG